VCAAQPGVHFIPTARAYLGADGQPQSDLFVGDRLHLSELGYRIWAALIKSHLDAALRRVDSAGVGSGAEKVTAGGLESGVRGNGLPRTHGKPFGEAAPEQLPGASAPAPGLAPRHTPIPLVYCTDLFHPHDDPDDHFDLATIFALPEFDLRGIVLDQGQLQVTRPGRIPVAQMNALTGRSVPAAIGLSAKLKSPADRALDQPETFQRGVQLILDTLLNSPRRVDIITVGSVRDLMAAYNREPDLFRERAGRVLAFIGEASKPDFREHNVTLDPQAFVGLMRSSLDVWWVPCFDGGLWQNGGRASYWQASHADLLGAAPPELIQFFLYALEKESSDPLAFLHHPVDPARRDKWLQPTRNLWCTAVFQALLEPPASDRLPFQFEPTEISLGDDGSIHPGSGPPRKTVQRFKVRDSSQYGAAMTRATAAILARFNRNRGATNGTAELLRSRGDEEKMRSGGFSDNVKGDRFGVGRRVLETVVVCPLTAVIHPGWRSRPPMTVAGRRAEVAAEQIRSVSKQRLGARLGALTPNQASELRRILSEMTGEP
jgi:hypothetical protein